MSHHTGRARAIAAAIAEAYPDEYETWFYFHTKGFKTQFLESIKKEIWESDGSFPEDHITSPFVWLETQNAETSKKEMTGLGGRDKLCEWTMANFDKDDSKNAALLSLCAEEPRRSLMERIFDTTSPGTCSVPEDEKKSIRGSLRDSVLLTFMGKSKTPGTSAPKEKKKKKSLRESFMLSLMGEK